MRKILAARTGSAGEETAAKLRLWLAGRPELRTLSTFSPLPGEIDLIPLVAEFPDRRWLFPRVEGTTLVLHHVTDPAAGLEPGAFGIREPAPTLPVVSFFEVDAFFCPGLAFDAYGNRLGRGRGFYDRMLEHARPGSLKIGVCHAAQLVPDVYGEPHDIPMDQVISA